MAKIHRVRPPTEIPQASLADVAFLLLVFFIATTTIGEEFGLSLILPAKSRNDQRQEVNRANVTVVTTDAGGNAFFVDGQPQDLRAIRQIIRDKQAANDKLIVSVEPHRQAPYRAMVDILDELKLAGATRISLKTRRQ
jgi:biopolymer transport protein ExbD